MYKKILVPYDMSMLSDKALEHAVRLSMVINNDMAEVILLHVVAEIPMYPLIGIKESSSQAPRVAQLVKHIEKVHEEAIKYIVQMIEKKRERKRTYCQELPLG